MRSSQTSVSLGFLMVALAFLFAPVASAQNVPFPNPLPGGGAPCPNSFGMSIADVTVQPGEIFELVVSLDNPNPIEGFVWGINSPSPASCQFLTTETGAGIAAYSAANGTLPPGTCDLFTTPAEVFGFMMFMYGPYQSSIYGTEIFRITCVAGMNPGEVVLPWLVEGNGTGLFCGEVIVTIADPTPALTEVMRGDVNLDTSCNLTDAINLLDYLYVGNFDTTCPDACDVDDSGSVNLADAVNLLSGLFGGGFMLEDRCMPDATTDLLAECIGSPCP